ncbi:hypothetical protein [Couchioplanes caeruleus]|uniref:hypothetical protein n=1 Tax=Couchioplanes caeruleus TaxID=56438 RepID=UPI0011607C7D|nr:hypothetical protein [Couchioplanes caeruleus]
MLDESADDAVPAGEALGGDLAVQDGGFEAGIVDAPEKVTLNGSRLRGRGFCPTGISCQVAAWA